MKRRKDSAFGLHFDFHARPYEGMPSIGETLREEDIREICTLLKPDLIQIDCKGHPGWASYPTSLGNAMPGMTQDTLALWRRVTKEEGVALYMHYSGVFDTKYTDEHPDEAIMKADGTRKSGITRTYSLKYANELLIPQLCELAGKYGVDGVWVDGECWAAEADFDPETLKAFEKESGIRLSGISFDPAAPEGRTFLEYNRELFRRYVRYYTEEVHKKYPDFQITSNWMYSDYMPEKLTVDLDYLSGDFSPWSSINSTRLAGRTLATRGLPWDLMSWNFRNDRHGNIKGKTLKTPLQIMQEAACVITQGGGYENYITQYRDGSPRMEQIRAMKPVADMIRAREKWCFRCKKVPQAAVLMSAHDRYLECKKLFSRDKSMNVVGTVALLCDTGHSVSVLLEHALRETASEYPLIAVPEIYEGLSDEVTNAMLEYASNGGSLLLTGINLCRLFENAGAPFKTGSICDQTSYFTLDGSSFASVSSYVPIIAESGDVAAWASEDERAQKYPFAVIMPFGKGKLCAVGADIGTAYEGMEQAGHKQLMNALSEKLYAPVVKITHEEGCTEVNLAHKNGSLLIQLSNMSGPHRSYETASFDEIQPCRDLHLSIRLPKKPERVLLQPEGVLLDYEYEDGELLITLDRLEMLEIIEIPDGMELLA
ncbi:MAG: hypothetical protein IKR85_03910 [Clostridia bacterium]|nr:hypothetical protein [Clostridia bacterium]